MATTINQYVPNQGEVEITVSAADVTAFTAAGTDVEAGTYAFDKILRKWEPVEEPSRTVNQTNVVGGTLEAVGDEKGIYRFKATFVDDYYKGSAGEYGVTDKFTIRELLMLYKDTQRQPGTMGVTPAGSSATMMTDTLTSPHVVSVSKPMIDADQEGPAEFTAEFVVNKDSIATAAHG